MNHDRTGFRGALRRVYFEVIDVVLVNERMLLAGHTYDPVPTFSFPPLHFLKGANEGHDHHFTLTEGLRALPQVMEINENGIYDHIVALISQNFGCFEKRLLQVQIDSGPPFRTAVPKPIR